MWRAQAMTNRRRQNNDGADDIAHAIHQMVYYFNVNLFSSLVVTFASMLLEPPTYSSSPK